MNNENVYDVMKKAFKDALREHDEEKRSNPEANELRDEVIEMRKELIKLLGGYYGDELDK